MSWYKWILLIILAVNFALNIWGIEWGLPERWHPDEVLDKAEYMYSVGELNHNYYTYGALPFYQVGLLAIAPAKLGQVVFGWHDFEVRSIDTLLARLLSALMGTGVVAATYGIASTLFDRRSGLISAALIGLTMGLVNLSHFATVDISSLWWFTMASFMSVRVWRTGATRTYTAAGICSGLAAAVRFVGGIAIVVLLVAHWCRSKKERRLDRLVLGVGSGLIALLAANLPMVALPCYFAIGYTKDFFFNGQRNADGPSAWLPLVGDYINATGWPLALLSLGGIVYMLWLLGQKNWRRQICLIAVMMLPYYFIVGRMHVSHLRYALPLAPFLLILAGKMLNDFMFNLPGWQRRFWQGTFVLTLVYSLAYVIVADLNFIHDSREQLSPWQMNNLTAQKEVEVTSYVTDTAQWFLNVTRRPHDNGEWSTRRALESNRIYTGILMGLKQVEEQAQAVGICAANLPIYRTWNEIAVERFEDETANFDLGSNGVIERRPEGLIVSELYYDRFRSQEQEPEGMFFRDLFNRKLPYELSEEIWYEGWPGLRPRVEFVNPKIRIYEIEKPQ
ncbi:MAG: hypothetical protein A3E37_01235 [Candidatus Andersenbacteria bacterium RIFCSPHIGHO2_12_FULL_46_9]|nr:MAG: hypothetical protein A3E37_01235 [Candidatus Andersenbacteria bacterium RIFCSPHIGHO2_12_FULL_46_9]